MLQICAVKNEPPRRTSLWKQIETKSKRLAAELDLILGHRRAPLGLAAFVWPVDGSSSTRAFHRLRRHPSAAGKGAEGLGQFMRERALLLTRALQPGSV